MMGAVKNKICFLLLLFAALLALFHFYTATYHTLLIGFADIDVFLYTLLNYLRNGVLYLDREPLSLTYEAGRSILKFPPLYVVPYFPWVDVTGIDQGIYRLLFTVHVIRYVLAFLLCGFIFGPYRNPRWWMLLSIIFSLCAPFYEALYGLTFDNLFLFLLALSLLSIRFRQQLMPVVFLSYAASVKIYPVIQLIPFLITKKWRLVIYCVVSMVLWLCVSFGVFGAGPHEFYFFHILPILTQEKVLCETGNLSIAAQFCSVDAPLSVLKIFFLFVTLAVAVLSIKRDAGTFENQALRHAFFICLPLLLMQNVWGNYQIILLVPISVLAGYAFMHNGYLKYAVMSAALLAWLPLTVSDNYPAMDLFYYSWLGVDVPRLMIDHMKPYSAVVLWLMLGFLLLRNQPVSRLK